MACDHDTPHPFAFPSAKKHYAADRPVRAEHLKLEVKLDFALRTIEGRATTTLAVVRDGALPVFDAEALEVRRVLVDGLKAEFDADGKRLTVHPPKPLAKGRPAVVAIDYWAQPERGLYFQAPDEKHPQRPEQAWTQGQDEDSRCWFPCLDAPAQKASTEVIATVPKRFEVLSNGEKVSDVVQGQERVVHHRLEHPHSPYLVTLVVGRFEKHVAKAGATQVVTLFPKGRKADALRCVERTPQMLKMLERLTGAPYPWGPQYAQVFVTEFIFGGMENTGATTLTDTVLHDARAHVDTSAEPLIVHELAHQWFGDLVTCRDWPHGWLNEGFATYVEVLWKEEADGIDEADWYRAGMLEGYLEEAGRYTRPIVTRKFDEPIEIFDAHLYEKGGLVLHGLRVKLGDADFFRVLQAWVERHRFMPVETSDLARVVESVTGHNVDRYLDEQVHSAGHVGLSVELGYEPSARRLKVQIKQTGEHHVDVELVVCAHDGTLTTRTLSLSGGDHLTLLPMEREPQWVAVDPRREVLGTLKLEGPSAWFRKLLTAKVSVRAQADAARVLGKDGSALSVGALARVLADEKAFWGVRAACAKALAVVRTPAARDTLLMRLDVKHPKARKAVVAALGEFREDPKVGQALERLAQKGDPSVHVEGEAGRALGKVRSPKALAVLKSMLSREAYGDVIQVGALEGLASLRAPEAWPLVLELTKDGHPANARRAALQAVAKLAEAAGKKHEAVDVVRRAFSDPQFRVMMEAFEAAQTLGDDALVGTVETLRFGDGRARRAAKETARALREKASPPKELAALRTELEALKGEVKALKEKLELRPSAPVPEGARPKPTKSKR